MSLRPGSLLFVTFYTIAGGVFGAGTAWLMTNAHIITNLLAKAEITLKLMSQ